jgi:hypothetical protein
VDWQISTGEHPDHVESHSVLLQGSFWNSSLGAFALTDKLLEQSSLTIMSEEQRKRVLL